MIIFINRKNDIGMDKDTRQAGTSSFLFMAVAEEEDDAFRFRQQQFPSTTNCRGEWHVVLSL